MQIGWNLLWFIIGVSLLVTVHEFGHYWVARKLGFKVLRFSIGFGKPLFKHVGRAPDHIEYVIAALPLGGYVRMLDEREGNVSPADAPRAFGAKAPWKRILVMLAGPAANILFAIVVLWGVYWSTSIVHVKPVVENIVVGKPAAVAGLRDGDELLAIDGQPVQEQSDAALGLLDAISDDGDARIEVRGRDGVERTVSLTVADPDQRRKLTEPDQLLSGLGFQFWIAALHVPPVLGAIDPAGPAAEAGLQSGDVVLSVDGQPMKTFNDFRLYIQARPETSVLVRVRRDGAEFSRRVTTVSATNEGKTIGRLMTGPPEDLEPYVPADMKRVTDLGPVAALGAATAKAWQLTATQAKFFARMLTGKISMKNLSSPIGIASYAGESARAGPGMFVMFLVLISLSLGFLNLLPIPILDGGQVVFVIAEWLKGSPLSERAQALGWHAGLVMLALLMGVAVFNDLTSRFGSS
ncbi:MAG TPA: RIP metalloprotease RseP [Steroidobacteraceae bacterium]|nr:RIP metalloprotease RseP [Steroidobacteraceae bacterium]